MKKASLRVNKYFLLFCLLTVPFFDNGFVNNYPVLDAAFKFMKISAGFVVMYLYLFHHRHSFNALDRVFFSYEALLLVSTLINRADIFRAITTIYSNLIVFMLYEIGFDRSRQFIRSQYVCFSVIIYANLACEILFPEGMYTAPVTNYTQNWILGYYNGHTLYYMMAICMALLYSAVWRRWAGTVMMIASVYVASVLVRSGGTLAALFVVGVLLVLYTRKICPLKYHTWWLVPLVFILLIVVLRVSELSNYVYYVSSAAFGKGSSFAARLELWLKEVVYILRSPVYGHGIESQLQRLSQYGWGLHTHNLVFEILHQGGIIGFVLFALVVLVVGRRVRELRYKRIYCIICIAFAGWIVNTLMEPYTTPFLVALFVVGYRSTEIEQPYRKMGLVSNSRTGEHFRAVAGGKLT